MTRSGKSLKFARITSYNVCYTKLLRVVIEKPSYLGAIQAISAYQPQFCHVDMEEDGADLLQVEDWFWKDDVKLMYAVPNAQNPSGISYSDSKRKHP